MQSDANMEPSQPVIRADESRGSVTPAPWFVIWTHPNQEVRADTELRNQGYPTWLPLWEQRLPSRQMRIEPLFRRYLFAQPVDGLWSSMRSTRGVSDILRTPSGTPREVPLPVINKLFSQRSPDGIIREPEPDAMKQSMPGRVTSGPFAEFVGICSRTAQDRVWLLLDIFGRNTEVGFARNQVEGVTA